MLMPGMSGILLACLGAVLAGFCIWLVVRIINRRVACLGTRGNAGAACRAGERLAPYSPESSTPRNARPRWRFGLVSELESELGQLTGWAKWAAGFRRWFLCRGRFGR